MDAGIKTRAESVDNYGGVPTLLIRELSRQLTSWRSLLPPALQWMDDDRFTFLNATSIGRPNSVPLFMSEGNADPIGYENIIDILTAHLRTRYYYARYILYRPLIYKALHFPELMSASEAGYCGLAMSSMCLWPSLMAPPRAKKRLVPHLFAWTQNFLGMLLIFKTVEGSDYLRQICEQNTLQERIKETAALMLDWIEDVKQVDGTAEWSWTIMERLFPGDRR